MPFTPEQATGFSFDAYDYQADSGEARFTWTLAMASGEPAHYRFTEVLQFVDAPPLSDPLQSAAFHRCLKYLHLALGISYYKAAAPASLTLAGEPIPPDVAAFFDKLYQKGLGEFSYVNQLDLNGRIHFPSDQNARDEAIAWRPPAATLVPIGGGKDSLVSIELLRAGEVDFSTFYLGDSPLIDTMAASIGAPHIRVRRRLSPELFELNRRGAYNGHVPISALIAFVAVAASILYGFDAIVLSNERSANAPNTFFKGQWVNHQYSKSLEFEQDFSDLVTNHICKDIHYFSLLRRFSELRIAKLFSRHPQHHAHFGSCNKGFRIHEPKSGRRWCNDCPKCRFVFLSLAPWLDKERLIDIFGHNLLADESQLDGFRELTGDKNFKPFECVGEVEESLAALHLIADRPEWRDDVVVQWFNRNLRDGLAEPEKLVQAQMQDATEDRIPERYRPLIDAS